MHKANPTTSTALRNYDYHLYSGNVANWVKFANSLRLAFGYAYRLCKCGFGPGRSGEVYKLIHIGVISSVNDRAALQHSAVI
jgi:hypothetical protein